MSALTRFHPTFLLKIADKPIIFYIIETLAKNGIKQFDIALRENPDQIEEALANGKRWGVSITYHLAPHEEYPFAPMLPAIKTWEDERVVFGIGDILPEFPLDIFKKEDSDRSLAITYPSEIWSGWCFIQTKTLKALNKKTSLDQFGAWIKDSSLSLKATSFLSTQTIQDLLNSNIRVIKNTENQYLLPSTAYQVENGVWLSRGISLHPSVKIETPIFIGEYCQIRAGVRLGPNAIVENHCIIDKGSIVKNSLICQNSYAGENLDIQDSIVDRALLVNLVHKTSIRIREDFILSELNHGKIFISPIRFLARIIALGLFLLLAPMYIYLKLTCHLQKTTMVQLPADEGASQWSFFEWVAFIPGSKGRLNALQNYFKYLPLLFLVFKGIIHFVGVSPRTKEEILKLPKDWKKLYLKSKIGLITLGKLDYGTHMTEDEQYASEAYYACQMSLALDFKLFFRWLKKKLFF
jgi:NDP-sugar pyrophosphorylase family protein